MIGLEPMAISSHLGWLLLLILSYPFILVGIQLAVFDIRVRAKVNRYFNWGFLVVVGALLFFHMQTEVVYGKYFLDLWQSK
nr:hypothetical protein [Vibrio vulnificus]